MYILIEESIITIEFSLIALAREKRSEFGAFSKSFRVSESEILLFVEIFLTISLIEMSTWEISILRSNIIC